MFFLLPVGMNYETRRCPVVTFSLMGANVLVYLISLICLYQYGEDSQYWIMQHFWMIPSQSIWYTYLTSMFVHEGFFHLLGNMIYLFLFGACVEDLIGRGRFLMFYLVGGLVAQLVFIAAIPEHFASEIPLGGSSGAIYACIGGYLLLRTGSAIDFRYFYFFFYRVGEGEFSLPAWVVILFRILRDLAFAIIAFVNQLHGGGVAFAAHVGGFFAGLGMVALFKVSDKRTGQKDPESPEEPAADFGAAVLQAIPETHNETPTIFLFDGGAQAGPFNMFQIQQMLSLGSVNREALYWSDGMTEWRSVSELA